MEQEILKKGAFENYVSYMKAREYPMTANCSEIWIHTDVIMSLWDWCRNTDQFHREMSTLWMVMVEHFLTAQQSQSKEFTFKDQYHRSDDKDLSLFVKLERDPNYNFVLVVSKQETMQ